MKTTFFLTCFLLCVNLFASSNLGVSKISEGLITSNVDTGLRKGTIIKFEFYIGIESRPTKKQVFGYFDNMGSQHLVHLNKKGCAKIVTESDSLSFFIQTSEFTFVTDKIHWKFLTDGGVVVFGVIPNYDSTKRAFDADPDLQMKIMNTSEPLYSLLMRQAVYDRYKEGSNNNKNKLIFASVKQKSFSTGGIYYKYDFLN